MPKSMRCSVPYCSNKHGHNGKNWWSFHDFPVDEEVRARWLRAIKIDEEFRIHRGTTFVCGEHFGPEDMYTSAGSGRTMLKRGVVPSRFHWNNWGKLDDATPQEKTQQSDLKVLILEKKIQQLKTKQQQPLIFRFCITDEDLRYFTRFSSKKVFTVFWKLIYSSVSRLKWAQKRAEVAPSTPQRKLPPIDEFFMFLCRVAAGLQEKTLSSIFSVSVATVRRTVSTWTSYLYRALGSLPLWMTREQVQATMPDMFKLYCPLVRVILDCIELRCETASSSSSSSLESENISNHKNHTTFKGLIGIAPCGAFTFVSRLYTGSISDIDMTQQSHILQLLRSGDGVSANKGFLNERMLSEVGATLITPPLKTSTQLSMEDIQKTEAIARLRILAERAICRVKEYHIWDGLVPLYLSGSACQLWAICCIMSNYQGPLDIKGKTRLKPPFPFKAHIS